MLTPNPSAVYDLCYNIHQIGVKIKVLYKACIRNLDLISSGAVCSIRELWSYFYSQIYMNIAQCVHHSTAFSALYIYKKVCCKLWCNYLCGPFRHIWMRFSTKGTRGAKGHLISERNFGVFKSPKKGTKLFEEFLP